MKIFVANVPFAFTGEDISQLFEVFGRVNSARMMTEHRSGKRLGYGFVVMPVESEALHAVRTLDHTIIEGREIHVSLSKANESTGKKNQALSNKTRHRSVRYD